MTSRDLLEVKSALSGPLWRLIKERITAEVSELRATGGRYTIGSLPDVVTREQMFMKANALEEFVDSFPSQIINEYKEQLEKEKKQNE